LSQTLDPGWIGDLDDKLQWIVGLGLLVVLPRCDGVSNTCTHYDGQISRAEGKSYLRFDKACPT
jgi:hypothetical protein